jgi:hypothetical protein
MRTQLVQCVPVYLCKTGDNARAPTRLSPKRPNVITAVDSPDSNDPC